MPVGAVNQFKGHFCGTVDAVPVTTGRAKFRMTAERNEFKFSAVGTAVHGAAIGRIPTVNHFPDVFHNNGTGMKCTFNFFIMLFKYFLKNVHKNIME